MKEIRWLGPILDCSGYASAGRGYLRACETAGIKIQARDRSRSQNLFRMGLDEDIMYLYERLRKTHVSEDCPTVQHQVPDVFYKDLRTRFSIGYTIFEMPMIPKIWVQCCNLMDTIWTGSQYSKDAFVNSGVEIPVRVLPHAIDFDVFNPSAEPWSISNRRRFCFLSVFDFTDRKAWKELLRAYWNAFSDKDDVCLLLKVFQGDFSKEARRGILTRIFTYRESLRLNKKHAPILLYTHDVPNKELPGLYRSADCYVGISREGFGLTYAEAMACGVPCIGPEKGGTRQFMNEDNSLLVKFVRDESLSLNFVNQFPIFKGLKWASHSWEDLSSKMRMAVDSPEMIKKKSQNGLNDLKRDLSFENIGKLIEEFLRNDPTIQKDQSPIHPR